MNFTLEDTIGIDVEIQYLQEKIFTILTDRWKGKSIDGYGRTHRVDDVPKWFNTTTNDYEDVYLNDKINANFSFIVSENSETDDGYQFENKAKIVVIANLKNLFNDGIGRQDERMHRDVIEAVRTVQRLGKIVIDGYDTGIENVFRGFDQSQIKFDDMQPYHVFAVNIKLFYSIKDKC